MSNAEASSSRLFQGLSQYGEYVSYSPKDVLYTLEFETGKLITQEEIDATVLYLNISVEHVNLMADRVLDWRRMNTIKDIYSAVFSVDLPDGTVASFSMKALLAATHIELPEDDFDEAGVREMYNRMNDDPAARYDLYMMLQDRLRIKN